MKLAEHYTCVQCITCTGSSNTFYAVVLTRLEEILLSGEGNTWFTLHSPSSMVENYSENSEALIMWPYMTLINCVREWVRPQESVAATPLKSIQKN